MLTPPCLLQFFVVLAASIVHWMSLNPPPMSRVIRVRMRNCITFLGIAATTNWLQVLQPRGTAILFGKIVVNLGCQTLASFGVLIPITTCPPFTPKHFFSQLISNLWHHASPLSLEARQKAAGRQNYAIAQHICKHMMELNSHM